MTTWDDLNHLSEEDLRRLYENQWQPPLQNWLPTKERPSRNAFVIERPKDLEWSDANPVWMFQSFRGENLWTSFRSYYPENWNWATGVKRPRIRRESVTLGAFQDTHQFRTYLFTGVEI